LRSHPGDAVDPGLALLLGDLRSRGLPNGLELVGRPLARQPRARTAGAAGGGRRGREVIVAWPRQRTPGCGDTCGEGLLELRAFALDETAIVDQDRGRSLA